MPVASETIHRRLTELPQHRSLDAALELFDALGYQYADELPLPIRNWPTGVRRLVGRNADPPIYPALHRNFHVVYTHLTTDHLSRTVERRNGTCFARRFATRFMASCSALTGCPSIRLSQARR